ncbi:MAG: radical SAM protein, partial [Staphylothermus sp.]|nr:radical SAM protein [Staphylothermus sp.]
PLVEDSLIIEPDKLVEYAIKTGVHGLCASFNEPTIQPEYLVDIGLASRGKNLYLTVVTNGYMSLKTLKALLEAGYTGFSIDIKGCPETYHKYLSADPTIVLRNAKYILNNGGHVEIVYLMVTGANDWEECFEWIIDNHIKYLGEDVPLHVNRYYPAFKYYEKSTPFTKLFNVYNKAKKAGIKYVYIGNILQEEYQDTRCPKCGKKLIIRRNYRVISWNLTPEHKCPRCGYKVKIFGEFIGF